MNRRSIRTTLAAAFLGAGLLIPAGVAHVAAYGDAKGPPCADFIVGNGGAEAYLPGDTATNTPASVVVRNALSRAACSKYTYTLVVLDAAGTTEIARQAHPGDPSLNYFGQPVEQWMIDMPVDAGTTVCFYMTSSSDNGKVMDRAPDVGCEQVVQDAGLGGRGHA